MQQNIITLSKKSFLFSCSSFIFIFFLLLPIFPAYATIPSGYTHSGNTVQTIVGNPTNGNASINIKPFNSASRSSYNNTYPELQVWSYASCSGCAIASVINAYGGSKKGTTAGHLINCGDVLEYESNNGYWDSSGLRGGQWNSIVNTAGSFGYKVPRIGNNISVDEIIKIANGGQPVIVGMLDHILDVRGGDANYILLTDSSTHMYTKVTRNEFIHGLPNATSYFDGHYAIITP